MKTFTLSQFENIAYCFQPSFRAAAFVSSNSCFKVLVCDSYFRISVAKDLTPRGTEVYVAKLRRPRMRTGKSFSSDSPSHLLQDVFDHIQEFSFFNGIASNFC